MAGYVLMIRALRRERVFRDRHNPFDCYDEENFRLRYKLTKSCANSLISQIRADIASPTLRSFAVSPELQTFIFLRFLATDQFYHEVGDIHGFSPSTVCRIIVRISNAIAALSSTYIKMPESQEEVDSTKLDFYRIANFPGVLGAIDCTHVRLLFNVPPENAAMYINRHHWYSLNVQVVCDARYRITNIVARWQGSIHDSRIWNNCRLLMGFESNQYQGYLLGDSGYPCSPYLLTPLLRVNNDGERRYNHAHIRTRITIERMFGQWKRRFPILKYGLRMKLSKVPHIIIAAAVLHNMAIGDGDLNFVDDNEQILNAYISNDHIYRGDEARGNLFRRRLIEQVFV